MSLHNFVVLHLVRMNIKAPSKLTRGMFVVVSRNWRVTKRWVTVTIDQKRRGDGPEYKTGPEITHLFSVLPTAFFSFSFQIFSSAWFSHLLYFSVKYAHLLALDFVSVIVFPSFKIYSWYIFVTLIELQMIKNSHLPCQPSHTNIWLVYI